jgi:thioredoxin reductase (NADPH)
VFEKEIDGVFIFIGYVPNTEMFEGIIELNQYKEIIVDKNMATNIPGVYAAGDSIAKRYRQVTTAVGEGTVAALSAAEYLNKFEKAEQVTEESIA